MHNLNDYVVKLWIMNQKEDGPKNEDASKKENFPKIGDHPINEGYPREYDPEMKATEKNEDDPKNEEGPKNVDNPRDKVQNFRFSFKRILIMCYLSIRAVYELCQGELILDVSNYDYDYVFRS